MGSPETENCRGPHDETGSGLETQHQVLLTHEFLIMDHEVTKLEFQDLMNIPAGQIEYGEEILPAALLTWHQAAAYCNALSEKQGLLPCYECTEENQCAAKNEYQGQDIYSCPGYRLPTEAEWEYAYRAGSTSSLYQGDLNNCEEENENASQIGWYLQNSNNGDTSSPVKKKAPNAWGLFDMAGNVWEWCHDNFQMDLGVTLAVDPWGDPNDSQGKVVRGGGFKSLVQELRAAERYTFPAEYFTDILGFRCVKTVH